MKIEIKDDVRLRRDLSSKAILIDNNEERLSRKLKKEKERKLLDRIDDLERRINRLEELVQTQRNNECLSTM